MHDTDSADQLLEDEEISWLQLSEGLNVYRVAWRAAEAIAGKFTRQSDKQIGGYKGLKDAGSQKQKQYAELACRLHMKALRAGPQPVLSGISISEKQAVADDQDRVPNLFRRDEFIIPGTEGAVLDQESGLPSA